MLESLGPLIAEFIGLFIVDGTVSLMKKLDLKPYYTFGMTLLKLLCIVAILGLVLTGVFELVSRF